MRLFLSHIVLFNQSILFDAKQHFDTFKSKEKNQHYHEARFLVPMSLYTANIMPFEVAGYPRNRPIHCLHCAYFKDIGILAQGSCLP